VTDKPKPWGYIDSEELRNVIRANERLVKVLPKVVRSLDRVPPAAMVLLQEAGFILAEQRGALARMEVIRANAKGSG